MEDDARKVRHIDSTVTLSHLNNRAKDEYGQFLDALVKFSDTAYGRDVVVR